MAGGMRFAKRRKALLRACAALEGIDAELWRAQGSELGPFMSLVDQLAQRTAAGRAAVLGEAVERGEAGEGISPATVATMTAPRTPHSPRGAFGLPTTLHLGL